MLHLHAKALAELSDCLSKIDHAQFETAVSEIINSRRIALYGVGREGLQIKGLAMRLFHLGLRSAVVGDMTTPPVAKGDLLVVSAGPGNFSTVSALIGVAKDAGARVLVVTAQPSGGAAEQADTVLHVPAQTMANDQGDAATSSCPWAPCMRACSMWPSNCLCLPCATDCRSRPPPCGRTTPTSNNAYARA